MESTDIICEMQEQRDAFEKSFSASAARTALGEGTEQQRAKSLYLATISFGIGQGKQLSCSFRADGAYAQHMQPAWDAQGWVNPPCRRGWQSCCGFARDRPPLNLGMP